MHSHDVADLPSDPRLRRALAVVVGVCLAATLVGLAVLWPDESDPVGSDRFGFATELVNATVLDVRTADCGALPEEEEIEGIDLPATECDVIDFEVTSGPTEGDVDALENLSATQSRIEPGDRIVLGYAPSADGAPDYYFADFQRRTPMLVLAVAFALAVVALGRVQGLRALLSLVLSLGTLVVFVLPALLDGRSPLAVALVGASVIALAALYLTHGLNVRSTTALLGTLASLGLTGVLASVFVALCHFTGLATEEATFLQVSADQIDLRGLLLAGIVIGSLGVLDDVTVTQTSAVWELRRANPLYGALDLYRAAVRIGRDHIASTVNTLVLAYAGASLPLLLLLTQAERDLDEVITGEVVAIEVVRTLVGSVGLVASVPITTGLAVVVATRAGSRSGGGPLGSRRSARSVGEADGAAQAGAAGHGEHGGEHH